MGGSRLQHMQHREAACSPYVALYVDSYPCVHLLSSMKSMDKSLTTGLLCCVELQRMLSVIDVAPVSEM